MSRHSEHPAAPTVALIHEPQPQGDAESDVVDWVMVTPQRNLLHVASLPALALFLGGSMVLAAPSAHALWAVLGALLITVAPVLLLLRLVRSSRGEAYLAIRKSGLAVRLDARSAERVFAWDHIDGVSCRPERHELVLWVQGAEEVLTGPFEHASVNELTVRIHHARRLGVWNRLTRGALQPWC